MAVLEALRRTPGALRRNPSVFVPAVALALLQSPGVFLGQATPGAVGVRSALATLVSWFVVPFFQAGLVGMADEALRGRTSLASFLRAGKTHYVPVLLAYLVVLVAGFVTVGVGVTLFLAGGALVLLGGSGPNFPFSALVSLVIVLVLLAYLAFAFLVQFYGQAIVVESVGAVEGLGRSAGLVRANLASTVGYSMVALILGGLLLLSVVGGRFLAGSVPLPALPGRPVLGALGPLLLVLLRGLLVGVLTVLSVAFYRAITAQGARRAGL